MELRALARDEIERIWTIDRRERIENIYRLEAGALRLEPHAITVPGWHPENVRTTTPLLYEIFDRGGLFLAALDGEIVAGIMVLDTVWRMNGLLQLELLHVGRDHRRHGLGTTLVEEAAAAARERGARGLYIEATPTENTVRFYQRRGAMLLDEPDPELFAREPEDIHFSLAV